MAEIDYLGKPEQSLEELLAIYTDDMYLVLDDVLATHRAYNKVYQNVLDILKWNYTNPSVRNAPLRFKFHHEDTKIFSLPRKNFLSYMILLRAFMDMDAVEVLDESYYFDFRGKNLNDTIEYVNEKILPHHMGDFHAQCATVDDIWHHMIRISYAFTPIFGLGISDYDIIQMEKRNPRLHELMYKHIDMSKQTKEIEDELNNDIKEIVDIIINDSEYNNFKPLYASGNNLSMGQSKEIFARIGFKADINGHTIMIPIDTNFLIGGLIRPSYFFINNMSGRKAGIMAKTKMSDPGAFSKQLNWGATSPSYLRQDEEMCDSTMTINYLIEDEQWLQCLNGRYYYDQRGNMQCVDAKKDKHLIGRRVAFRSPSTCNSKEGICKYCYGKLFNINKDLFSVGALSATKSSNPLGFLCA